MIRMYLIIFIAMMPTSLWAQSLYCPKNHQYISVGMTSAQVVQACGQPIAKRQGRGVATRRIPVTQYIYNQAGAKKAFYGTWQLSTGQGGTHIVVDVVDNRVQNIKMAGSSTQAFSLCGGSPVVVGDPVGRLTSACGAASAVNQTFIDAPTGQSTNNEMWVYQLNQFQPAVRLTFVNGKLESIQ